MVTGTQEKGKAAATHADNLTDKFGRSLNDKHKGLTLEERLSANDSAKIDSQVGQALGTDFHSEGAAAVALMGGGAVAAEAFQALRGQKGPIRTTFGKLSSSGKNIANKLTGKTPDEPSNYNGDSPINQNDSTHNATTSKNSDTIITEIKKTISQKHFQVKF